MAIFCDYENVAIGVRDARFDEFNIGLVIERLLDKGNIVVKKAYADWSRYKSARRPLHEAAFELIEIPHVSYSGKNSADIRLVVDALDLCYTKEHVHMFVIVSGDSDFSPLVSKLRENNKTVIGLGVKNSSAELLIDNCDQFIFYDDLVRPRTAGTERPRGRRRGGDRDARAEKPAEKPAERPAERPVVAEKPAAERPAVVAEAPAAETESVETLRLQAIERVLDTVDSLFRERDDSLWGSMVKQTIKRKQPQFAETFHGYRNFNRLLEDMRDRGLLEIQKEEKSGGYLILGFGPEA
ncbi:MAG: NYN domain-containing protein [Myxococcales bacterium]|nr:NYN domain-containing protein [Myxococcales bacterium]